MCVCCHLPNFSTTNRLIRISKVVTPLIRGLQQAWSTIVAVAWEAALYRFSVRLISRTHDRTAAATHTLARTHSAYITRVRACTHARTPRGTVESPYYLFYLAYSFPPAALHRRLREFNLRERVWAQGRLVLDIAPRVLYVQRNILSGYQASTIVVKS